MILVDLTDCVKTRENLKARTKNSAVEIENKCSDIDSTHR